METEVTISTNIESRRRYHWYTYLGDFLNTLKAFMGTNYQGLPFAFAQSGLAFGLVGVFLVATFTDHCCQILVRCKIYIIEKIIKHEQEHGRLADDDVAMLRERLQLAVGYGDVAKRVLGAWCFHVTQACVCFTQFMVCVMYFVFIANTVCEFYPLKVVTICHDSNNQSIRLESLYREKTERGGYGIPMLYVPNLYLNSSSARSRRSAATRKRSANEQILDLPKRNFQPQTDLNANSTSPGQTEELVLGQQRTGEKSDFDAMQRLEINNTRDNCSKTSERTGPDLRLIVLYPLPFFVMTSLIRNVRLLAPLSSIATFAMTSGMAAVFAFIVRGFSVTKFDWYKWNTLPVFLCQLIAAYEGIGCILPIQSSMVGCRHLFPAYLHANIYIIFVVLCLFGCTGYLRYGNPVNQIVVLMIEQQTLVSVLIDAMLIVSVLFTYPLQCYPVIEIMESAILSPSQCGRKKVVTESEEVSGESAAVDTPVVQRSTGMDFALGEIATTVLPPSATTWKRNCIRVVVTLFAVGLSILLRDYFAFLQAIAGALGASFLAFILPCLIDIRLRKEEMSRPILIKNVVIIVVVSLISIVGLVVTFKTMAEVSMHASSKNASSV